MRFRSLGSGSTGNATIVEARSGSSTARLLVDCGLGIRQLEARLALAGLSVSDIDAVFITHEHADHVGCALTLARQHRLPLWMSSGTHSAIGAPELADLPFACDGESITIGCLQVTPFTVPHDAREPLQLTCTDGRHKLGLLTDLGHASAHVLQHLQGCDALLLETNHDPDMLGQSGYPPFLKARVAGRFGHLSNADAADILKAVSHAGLGTVVAAHLSVQNNRPQLATAALAGALGWTSEDIVVADAAAGTDWLCL